jgi:GT2 family glycosyltransferase
MQRTFGATEVRKASRASGVGVVIPTYNRVSNLRLCLASLARQSVESFHVVVADDGSTDGTRDLVESLASDAFWCGRLHWIGCGVNQGFRAGRARNVGVANLPISCSLVVMVDSDTLMAPCAIEIFADLHTKHPDALIIGRMDWLPPQESESVTAALEYDFAALMDVVPESLTRPGGTFVGPDPRRRLFDEPVEVPVPMHGAWLFPSNSGCPIKAFVRIGGYDESIAGYGMEDVDFGVRADLAGYCCVISDTLVSLHVWHPKAHEHLSLLENQRNLDIVLRRYPSALEVPPWIDWSCWWHYRKARSARLVAYGGQLWALNGKGDHRILLMDPTWVTRLGFLAEEVKAISASELVLAEDVGVAVDSLHEFHE